MKNRLPIYLHILVGLTLLSFAGYIVHSKYFTCQKIVQNSVETALIAASGQFRDAHKQAIYGMENIIWQAGGQSKHLDSLFIVRQLQQSLDTLIAEIDHLGEDFDEGRSKVISRKLYHLKVNAMEKLNLIPNYSTFHDFVQIPGFSMLESTDSWLIQAKSIHKPEDLKMQFAQAKVLAAIFEDVLTAYYLKVSNPGFCGITRDYIDMRFSCLNISVGDTIQADVCLNNYQNRAFGSTIALNGQPLNFHHGEAPFKLPLTRPGRTPLQVRICSPNPRTGSMEVFEKTYFVRVQE